jgi:hypothetical protein
VSLPSLEQTTAFAFPGACAGSHCT